MYGGLLKSASALAIFAAAGMFASANAADLGGDCCADLEERVAELEATTVRKGNRKIKLTVSGFVSHNVMWWDDGSQSDMYIGDGGNYGSRWRFVGTAKINPQMSAGFLYEFGVNNNAINSQNQGNGGDDLGGSSAPELRDSTVWLRHNQLGMVKVGHGSTSTDNLILIDLSGRNGAGTPDIGLYGGGMIIRGNNGQFAGAGTNFLTWAGAIRGHESFDTTRRNHVLYETPTLAGFTLQAAVAEDNYWDVALRYAGEFGGFRIAAGIGYQEDTEFNAPAGGITGGATSVVCTTNCNVKTTDLKGSASILHIPTGLFVTGAAGKRELEGNFTSSNLNTAYIGPDLTWWHLAAGISQNFFGIGRTVLFGEYTQSEGGLEQTSFLSANALNYNFNQANTGATSSEMTQWGLGVTQHIDAAAMEVFATYKNYSLDATGFTGALSGLNKNAGGVSDFQTVIVGTRISF